MSRAFDRHPRRSLLAIVVAAGGCVAWPLGIGCSGSDSTPAGAGGSASSSTTSTTASTTTSTSATTSSTTSSSTGEGGAGGSASGAGGSASGTGGSASGAGGTGGHGGGSAGGPGIDFSEGTPTTQYGNLEGGTLYEDACPAGQVVVGFSGFLSAPDGYHGRIQTLCGTVGIAPGAPPTVTLSPGDTLPLRGDLGDAAWASTCPADEMVVGFSGRAGLLVDQIALRCAAIVVTPSPAGLVLLIGPVTDLAPVGGAGGDAFPVTDCAAGQVATMSRIRAGDSVDAFGLACSVPSLVVN